MKYYKIKYSCGCEYEGHNPSSPRCPLDHNSNIIEYAWKDDSFPVEAQVMQMLTEEEIKSGWRGWLSNTFTFNKEDFAKRIKLALNRRGLPENVRQILNNYYTELSEINKRYLDASKHSTYSQKYL